MILPSIRISWCHLSSAGPGFGVSCLLLQRACPQLVSASARCSPPARSLFVSAVPRPRSSSGSGRGSGLPQQTIRRQISFSSFFFRPPPPPPPSSNGGAGNKNGNQRKIESYFNAIGGQSDDPPPDLTPEQVMAILRTHESLIFSSQTASENEKFIESFRDALDNSKNKRKASGSSASGPQKSSKQQAKLDSKSNQKNNNDNKQFYSLINNRWLTSVESNQLASNHPIEDRIRISTLNLDSIFDSEDSGVSLENSSENSRMVTGDQCIGFGVFDGHNGGLCADIITKRLFHYIAIALKVFEMKKSSMAHGSEDGTETKLAKFTPEMLTKITTEHVKSPSARFYYNLNVMYEPQVAENLRERIEQYELESLQRFAEAEFSRADHTGHPDEADSELISGAIRRAFVQCDEDLSREIEQNLLSPSVSNILIHYYLSLSVSGSCATVVILHNDHAFVASTGDCRAVMGELRSEVTNRQLLTPGSGIRSQGSSPVPIVRKTLKAIDLSNEHNSDNISELNRLMGQHPKEEHNHIIRENRLLGQLMPLRAFGDFSFKWSVEKMKQLGLTRAFGSHIIPSHYRTPPYLTAEPEIITVNLLEDNCGDRDNGGGAEHESNENNDDGENLNEKPERIRLDRFIVLATDGLWEQFESARKVIKAVNRYRQNVRKHVKAYASADLLAPGPSNDDSGQSEETQNGTPSTLGEIADRLRERQLPEQSPVTTFERVTADDDLIEDINCGTFLLRIALSDISAMTGGVSGPGRTSADDEEKFSHHVDQYEQQQARHAKLVSYLTLPQSVVRNFRDDISLIVIGLK